jgi:hypothetical protein
MQSFAAKRISVFHELNKATVTELKAALKISY